MTVPSTPAKPSTAWVSIECIVANRVALPPDSIVNTSGGQKMLMRHSNPFYVIGHGQAIAVTAGDDRVARQIVRTVVPTGQEC
ncbi:MAG: hypothetical protein J2P57_17740 [Acidimicrobiaceae bacterium]|nr:hypothetical protein [Acidimicrobiaceae bacterium]